MLVGRTSQPHAIGLLYFGPSDQALQRLSVGYAAPPGTIGLVHHAQSRFHVVALEGHTVYEAADGRSGVESAEALRPDVALVDIGLPEVDGYEVARTLRARLDGSIVLIALTGYGQPEDERRAREAGFDAHLVKPADIDRLRSLIRYSAARTAT